MAAAVASTTGVPVPHSTLSPCNELVPQSTDSPLTFVPQRTEVPHNTEVPHRTDLPPSTEEPFTRRTTFPLASTVAAGDMALPTAGGARLVFANAAWMSRSPQPPVKMAPCS